MRDELGDGDKRAPNLWILAMINSGVWALSIIALVFVIQRSPGAKGLFPILAGGTAVAGVLLSASLKLR